MISLIRDCSVYIDNGTLCGDNCFWNAWWESEEFLAGEEIDEDDPHVDISGLTHGEDFVRL